MSPDSTLLPARPAGRFTASGVNDIQARPEGRWLVSADHGSCLVVLDAVLEPIWQVSVPEARWPGCHAVSPDLQLIALSRRSEVQLLAGSGEELGRIRHPPWPIGGSGACAFDLDGRTLWAYVTTDGGGDELLLIDLPSQEAIARATTDTTAVGVTAYQQAIGPWMGWSVGEGQDGALVLWSRRDGGRLVLRQDPDDTCILVDIHPDGAEYLTTPHSGDLLQRHALEDGRVLAETAPPEGDALDASWGIFAAYLSPERIIATINRADGDEATYVLDRASLQAISRIDYADQDPGWLAGASRQAWLTVSQDGVQRWVSE